MVKKLTFSAFIKKEWLESTRDNKLIVLLMGFLFFALSTPPMLKLVPSILAKQYGADMANLIKTSALDSVSNFLVSNFPQICILVLCLSLGGVLCNEISKGTIILPLSKGANKKSIVLSKFAYYSIVLLIISTVSVVSNIYYSYIIFETEFPSIFNVLICCFYVYLYVIFIMSVLFFFSSFFNKGTMVALITMGINVILSLLNTFNYSFNPFSLVSEGAKLNGEILTKTITITLALSIVLLVASVYLFSKKEIDS